MNEQRKRALRLVRELAENWEAMAADPVLARDAEELRADAAAFRALAAQPEQEPVRYINCQYGKDVGMPEYSCHGACQYAAPVAWAIIDSHGRARAVYTTDSQPAIR